MGRTAAGETPRIRPIAQSGGDGKVGTGDDIPTIGPGESGNAEFLVEGRREGSHVVEMEITATLNGLPVGPVPIRGRAAGAVLVRNPSFTLTFAYPDVVNAGEPYSLDVTVTNTSTSPANFVSLNLHSRNIVGAVVSGGPSRQIQLFRPECGDGDVPSHVARGRKDHCRNARQRWQCRGPVRATAIGEFGVPLSPDSLVLPKEANALPLPLRQAAIGLLGGAYAVATTPPAALPANVTRFHRGRSCGIAS